MSARELWELVEGTDYGAARLELADAAHGAARTRQKREDDTATQSWLAGQADRSTEESA